MKILALIPARAGSKGIPGKNLKVLAGKPLLAYSIGSAQEVDSFSRIVVSTEDRQIADVALQWGAEVPFLRPPELATDETPTLPVVQHALLKLGSTNMDAVCLLQPTCPFRSPALLRQALTLFGQMTCDSLVTIRAVPKEHHPDWLYQRDEFGLIRLRNGQGEPAPRRQGLTEVFFRDGSIYLTRTDVILNGSLYGTECFGLINEDVPWVNLDTPEDWTTAQALVEPS